MRVAFGRFTFDSETRQLLGSGSAIHLSPKAFDLLQLLLERRPGVVAKADVLSRVWPGTFVEDANLSVVVAEIRRALDDDPKQAAFIRTVHGRGYAFSGAVHEVAPALPPGGGAPAARCSLAWRDRLWRLEPGEHVIGRDPGSAIWMDARGVSRRHASLVIGADGIATLRDLGSTNGTFVADRPLTAPRTLADGDTIGVGPETVTFHVLFTGGPPPTERVRRKRGAP